MDINLEIKWLYTQYKKGLGVPDCWDVTSEKTDWIGSWFHSDGISMPKNEDFPLFLYPNTIDSIETLNTFVVVESAKKRIWFNRNNVGRSIKVCKLGEGEKIEVDVNRLLEMRSEIMGIINHLRSNDYGLAMIRAEIIREKLNKLM